MTTSEPLGSARIDIEANVKPLEAGMERAKAVATTKAAEIQRAAVVTPSVVPPVSSAESQAAVNAVRSVRQEVEATEKAATSAAAGIRAMMGQALAGVAAAAVMYNLGQRIREVIIAISDGGIEKAQKFRDALDFTNVGASLTATDAKLGALQAKLAASQENAVGSAVNFALGDTQDSLKKEIEELQKTASNLRRNARAKDTAERKKEADEESAKNRAAASEALDKEQRAFKRTQNDDFRAREREAERELEAERLASTKERAAVEAKAASSAMAAAKAWESAIRRIQDQQAALFNGNDIPVMLQQLTGAVDALTRARQNGGGF